MHRIFLDFLRSRNARTRQVPLLVRGARQTGKSHTIREFGNLDFEHLIEVNFELSPQLGSYFTSRNPEIICRDLEVLFKADIIDGKSLLFIDEIQESPDALLSLRAFKEQRPGLDVIAAGSLLEFALDDTTIRSFPVGRVSFAWMHPFSFQEFLRAMDEQRLVELLQQTTLDDLSGASRISDAMHNKLLDHVREYFVVGGMPEVVDVYRETKSFLEARKVQSRLSLGYVADFVKYGARYDHRKLQSILSAVPRLVGRKFKYTHIEPDARARDFKQPLLDLEKAGLVRLIRATSANGLPLAAEEKSNVFKVNRRIHNHNSITGTERQKVQRRKLILLLDSMVRLFPSR